MSVVSRQAYLGLIALLVLVLASCQPTPQQEQGQETLPPYVRTAKVQAAHAETLGLSGTLRARLETPLAFQVGGRIIARHVDAGQHVSAGYVLLELDPSDLEQAIRRAKAEAEAAQSAWRLAQADLLRSRELQARQFISPQALERAELTVREAESRRDAAVAALLQAQNARAYARLHSPASGVLTEVSAEPGQVVAAGQTVAILAQDGEREIEVYLPDGLTPPREGEALFPDGERRPLHLRELAPRLDAASRTRRARYTLGDVPASLTLGSIVSTRFMLTDPKAEPRWQVPLAALDERGQGPRVWRVGDDGQITALPVQIHHLDGEHAVISGPLQAGERVVALGTHLLKEGMRVRVQTP